MNKKFIVVIIIVIISLLALFSNAVAVQKQNAPILSPGEWIVFSKGSNHNTSDTELYAVRPDGSELIQITSNSYSDWQPRLSPDGTKLAYCRYPTVEKAYLYVMDMNTGEDELILDVIFCGDSYYWLADNNRIIYQAGGQARIIDITSKEVTIIKGTTPNVRHPSISPDMLEIAYSGDPWALYVQSVDGNGTDRHTLPGSNPRGATWNPEGTWIAFESYSNSLQLTKTDGSSLKSFGSGYAPAWSPDGTQIAYHNLSGGKIFAVIIDSNGNASGHRTVVSPGGWIAYVSWGRVVYEPETGLVTGGGWIDSQPGAYLPDPSLIGKASFGFVAKYKNGATVPTGNTEFQFKVADLNFHSTNYEWLVVTNNEVARFKGTGTINGMGKYKFMIWAGDGDPDTFRIKIWEKDELGVETVIYDNGPDQEIGGGSIVVHTGK